jgi:hypothetical protein
MKISMFAVRVRFVSDANGALEGKPGRVVVTLARDHEDALQQTRAHFLEIARLGVTLEYGDPSQLHDTVALESLVYA